MEITLSNNRYGPWSMVFHWLMLLLLAAVYASMEFSGNFPKGSDMRALFKTWHYMLGLSVFVLVWIRLAINLSNAAPRIQPEPPLWQTRLAQGMKVALYVLMVGLPIAGWLTLSAKGEVIPFFGLQLPPLMSANKGAAGWIKEIHETGATAGYFLVGLHAAAALYHHYFLRDNTLRRMLPGRD